MWRTISPGVAGLGLTVMSTFEGSLGLTVGQQRIGFVVGAMLILTAIAIAALTRRDAAMPPHVTPTPGAHIEDISVDLGNEIVGGSFGLTEYTNGNQVVRGPLAKAYVVVIWSPEPRPTIRVALVG